MKKKNFTSILLYIVFIVGIGIMVYPSFSDWWNSKTQSRAIMSYENVISNLNSADYTKDFAAAEKYNMELAGIEYPFVSYEELPSYEEILNVGGNGMMGFIEISKIDVKLPIYHGTSENTLAHSAGHLEGSSLPIGGESTHAVISAHRGLPSAKLFTNLDRLVVGDTFVLTILDRTLTYQVDQIRVVLPEETKDLVITEGEDYCTLITCTPYGVNSHRLLVRGTRVENGKAPVAIANEAYKLDSLIMAPIVAAPILVILLIIVSIKYRKKK